MTPNVFYGWKEKFVDAGKLALAGSFKKTPDENLRSEVESLKKLIGELTIANDAMKKVLSGKGKNDQARIYCP